MAAGERLAAGLSVGATNLAAVTADRAVVRKSVVTLYRQRPAEVGALPGDSPGGEAAQPQSAAAKRNARSSAIVLRTVRIEFSS